LSGIAAAPVSGPVVFAPGALPGPEQPLWEGRPSLALLFGKLVRVIIRCLVVFTIGYFAVTIGLPALASMSPEMRSLVEQNANALQLGIAVLLALAVLPSVVALPLAIARIKNTHYKV